MITQQEIDLIAQKCRDLPSTPDWRQDDYVMNLFLTVLEFQLRTYPVVQKAIDYYKKNRWSEARTHDDLKRLFSKYPDDKEGNTCLAQYLWNYKLWTRVSLLRKLVAYFESIGVSSQETLIHWAKTSTFEKDFKGKIPGLSFAVYQWLIVRQGLETVKPDIHLRRFVKSIIHRDLPDNKLVGVLENVAKQLGLKACELDWRIWDYQRKMGKGAR